jgi:GT2 family glycosyltransferase
VAVVPAYLAMPAQVEPMARCLVSLWATAPGIQAIVVDDGSPETAYVDQLAAACDELGFEIVRRPTSSGRAAAINVGLRAALEAGADALVVDPAVEFDSPGWLEALQARTDSKGRPAAVVGARLMQRHGLIAEAGMYFSLLRRSFLQRYANAPGDLPAALVPTACPVGGRLQLIRHETIAAVGLYDEAFRAGHGDIDYALRVFGAGHECIYEPSAAASYVPAVATDPVADDTWHPLSSLRLREKYLDADLRPYIPEIL